MSAQPVDEQRREAQAWAEGILARHAVTAQTKREEKRLVNVVARLAANRVAKDHCVLCGFPSIGPLCIGHSDLAEAVTHPTNGAA